jgi:tetratricopeptide (TPR) repeat protein
MRSGNDPCRRQVWVRGEDLIQKSALLSAMAIVPETAGTWYDRGQCLCNSGKYLEAVSCYDVALKRDPENFSIWKRRGFALLKLKRYEEAADCFGRVLEISPADATAWQRMCYALGHLRRFEEAMQCCERALELRPEYVTALQSKGWLLSEQGRYEEALSCYDRVLQIDPERESAHSNRERLCNSLALEQLRSFVAEAERDVVIPDSVYAVLETCDHTRIWQAWETIRRLL